LNYFKRLKFIQVAYSSSNLVEDSCRILEIAAILTVDTPSSSDYRRLTSFEELD